MSVMRSRRRVEGRWVRYGDAGGGQEKGGEKPRGESHQSRGQWAKREADSFHQCPGLPVILLLRSWSSSLSSCPISHLHEHTYTIANCTSDSISFRGFHYQRDSRLCWTWGKLIQVFSLLSHFASTKLLAPFIEIKCIQLFPSSGESEIKKNLNLIKISLNCQPYTLPKFAIPNSLGKHFNLIIYVSSFSY